MLRTVWQAAARASNQVTLSGSITRINTSTGFSDGGLPNVDAVRPPAHHIKACQELIVDANALSAIGGRELNVVICERFTATSFENPVIICVTTLFNNRLYVVGNVGTVCLNLLIELKGGKQIALVVFEDMLWKLGRC
jgi:hypothetical protein